MEPSAEDLPLEDSSFDLVISNGVLNMTVLAFLTERAPVKKVLEHLDLPTAGPAVAKARCSVDLDFAP